MKCRAKAVPGSKRFMFPTWSTSPDSRTCACNSSHSSTLTPSGLYMELVRNSYADGFHLRVCQHLVIIEVRDLGFMYGDHLIHQIFCLIADSVQFGVVGLAAASEVSSLRDGSTA